MVDFPAPDSPISPRTSPRFNSRLTLSTRTLAASSSPSRRAMISRSVILRMILWSMASGPPGGMDGEDPVDDQVDADHQEGDRRSRDQGSDPAENDGLGIVADHAAPVGERRLDAEPEEAQRGDEEEGEAEAQPELGDQRRKRVGQD